MTDETISTNKLWSAALQTWFDYAPNWGDAADRVTKNIMSKYKVPEEFRSVVWNAAWEGIREVWNVGQITNS